MDRSGLVILAGAALLGACSGGDDPATDAPLPDPASSALAFQAVDAGTGAALANRELTVRYLVRAPVTIDETAVDEVASAEPSRVAHSVAEDSLVVEVRLEAPSYHTMDTVLAVARGNEAGPFTLRMTRRLEQAASRPAPRPATRPAAEPPPAEMGGGIDLNALRAGDRAFRGGSWLDAVEAYRRMTEPPDPTGSYARDYQAALVRRAESHMNLGEMAAALEVLEEASSFDFPNYNVWLRLGQVRCEVGRTDEGRAALDRVDEMAPSLNRRQRPLAVALAQYRRGLCSQRDFERAEGAIAVVRAGAEAVQTLETFLELAGEVPNPPQALTSAVADAENRIEEIREQARRGGGDGALS